MQSIQAAKRPRQIRWKKQALAALTVVMAVLVVWLGVFLLKKPKGMAHYLLLGVDGWGLNTEGAGRSDVIMLASLDYDGDRIALTSFARDGLIRPKGFSRDIKINSLVRYSEGEQGLVDYLQTTYGVPIEGYFVINFSGAVDIINAIGGVSVELTEQEVQYLKKKAGDYDNYHLHAGLCRMNGAQALEFMRCRKLDSDYGRQDRQAKVLRAVMDELKNITAGKAVKLLESMTGMYRTSLSAGEQIELVKNAVHLRRASLEKYSIPTQDGYSYGEASDGTSGLKFNLEKHQALLRGWLGLEEKATEEKE